MPENVCRSIDHIMVRVKEAQPLMDLFAGTLGLPVSWPLECHDFSNYGWVTLGNTNLEFWASADNADLPGEGVLPLFHGLALEPDNLGKSIAMLGERGILCKSPRPYITTTTDGRDVTNFTNAVVLDVSSPLSCIFFCEWGVEGTIFPWTEKRTVSERKRKEQAQLLACGGGKLGITGLVEVQIVTPTIVETEAKWLAITGQASTPLRLGNDVRLHLLAADEHRIESIVLGVRSLATARSVLADMGLLGQSQIDEVSLSPIACSGLQFRFRQTEAA